MDTGNASVTEGDGCDTFQSVSQCSAIYALRTALATFSLLGCFFIFASIIITRRYRNFGQRMIMYLSIAACLDTFPYLFGRHHEIAPVCQFQAFWMTWFDWAVLSWVCCITHSLYINVVKLKPSTLFERRYHAIAWALSLIVASIPLAANKYGSAGLWCWIVNTSFLRFGLWYIPLLLCIISLFAANFYIYLKVRNMSKQFQGTYNPEIESQKQFLRKQVQPLKLYPFVYLCVSIFPFVNRVQNWANPGQPIYWLYIVHSLCSPMQGFLNALIYASNTDKGFWNQCNVANFKRTFTLGKGRGGIYVFDQGDGMQDGIINGDGSSDDDDLDDYLDDDAVGI